MKSFKLFVAALMMLSIFGCSKKEKDRLIMGNATVPGSTNNSIIAVGSISLYMGGQGTYFSPAGATPAFPSLGPATGELTIAGIDISIDGIQWISLLSSPLTTSISTDYGNLQQLTIDPVTIPEDEYHSIRIRLPENALSIQTTRDGVDPNALSLNAYPSYDIHTNINNPQGPGNQVTLTSANQALVPFRVEAGKTLYIVLGIKTQAEHSPAWALGVAAATTRIIQ